MGNSPVLMLLRVTPPAALHVFSFFMGMGYMYSNRLRVQQHVVSHLLRLVRSPVGIVLPAFRLHTWMLVKLIMSADIFLRTVSFVQWVDLV